MELAQCTFVTQPYIFASWEQVLFRPAVLKTPSNSSINGDYGAWLVPGSRSVALFQQLCERVHLLIEVVPCVFHHISWIVTGKLFLECRHDRLSKNIRWWTRGGRGDLQLACSSLTRPFTFISCSPLPSSFFSSWVAPNWRGRGLRVNSRQWGHESHVSGHRASFWFFLSFFLHMVSSLQLH